MNWASTLLSNIRLVTAGGPRALKESKTNEDKRIYGSLTSDAGLGSSISDITSYVSVVSQAASVDSVYRNFRSMVSYQEILEHVSYTQGKKYLRLASQVFNDSEISKYGSELSRLSEIGNPPKFSYGKVGLISPTILRYLKVASDLKRIFGNLDKCVISEIGIGFGGQVATLGSTVAPNSTYKVFDLPPVLALAERVISEARPGLNVEFFDGREPKTVVSDLVISNYAFSELNRSIQDAYLEKVIKNSNRGYITWNDLSFTNSDGYSLDELLSKIKGSHLITEEPLTAPNNTIIIWGAK